MKKQYLISTLTLPLLIVVSGCGQRDTPPATPAMSSATPTYRSTVNSYEEDTAPKYTQSGINGGEPVTLPHIASPDRFSQNTPLATAVYNAVRVTPSIDSRYVTFYSKGSEIKISGTVHKSEEAALLALVKKQPGVKTVDQSQLLGS